MISVHNKALILQKNYDHGKSHLQKVKNRLNCFGCAQDQRKSKCNTHQYIQEDIIYEQCDRKIRTGTKQ